MTDQSTVSRIARRWPLPGAVAAAIVLGAAALPAAAQGWWNLNWPCRRAVTVASFSPSKLPGSDVIVVTMPTAGLIADDGQDIRVVSVGGTEVPCRVLMVGPGDQVTVAFAARSSRDTRYHVYFGNRAAAPRKETLDIRRGVLLEVWRYTGGPIATLEQVRQTFERAASRPANFVGRGFRSRVFLGHNPFGPENRLASRFTAFFEVNDPGEFAFSISSQDASFLLIDEKLLVANGGHHWPQGDIRHRGSTRLDRGLHKLTLYHVCTQNNPVAVAAWQAPGEQRIWTIPASAFTGVHHAAPGAMERYGRGSGIDFLPRYGGEVFLANRYYQRWTFEALTVGQVPRSVDLLWDFGDGQKSGRPKVEHVYFTPGPYTVTLSAPKYPGALKQTNRIFVSRPWDQVAENKLDPVSLHAQIVSEYDFADLSAEGNAHAVLLLDRAAAAETVKQAALALVARDKGASGELMEEAMPLAEKALDPNQAARAYVRAAEITPGPAVKARFLVRAAQISLDRLNDPNQAMRLCQRAVRQYGPLTTDPAIRMAKVGLGDVWRVRGNLAEARRAYESAGLGGEVDPARLAIIKGDYARHVEDYVRKGLFTDARTYIDRWAANIPADKLEGYWSLLVVRKHLAAGEFDAAAREARVLVGANGASQYAPDLLLLASDALVKLKRPDEARAALRQIVQKYPESALAAQAARRLED